MGRPSKPDGGVPQTPTATVPCQSSWVVSPRTRTPPPESIYSTGVVYICPTCNMRTAVENRLVGVLWFYGWVASITSPETRSLTWGPVRRSRR